VAPSAGVTLTEGGPETASWPLGVAVGRAVAVALGEAAGARLHPPIAMATAPSAIAHPRRLTAARDTLISV